MRRKRDWAYHTCDECGDRYPSIDNSIPRVWSFDPLTGKLACDVCLKEAPADPQEREMPA